MLSQDRAKALVILRRSLSVSRNADAKLVKEKIKTFGNYFLTDKGFQAFQVGKDLFIKRKYADAVEKFNEAEELEKGNFEVASYLILSQVALNRSSSAEALLKNYELEVPIDKNLRWAHLAWLSLAEKWPECVREAEALQKEFSDDSIITMKEKAVCLEENEQAAEAKKVLEQIIARDKKFPEAYILLADMGKPKESLVYLKKYVDLCTPVPEKKYDRELKLCKRVDEATEKVKKLTP